MRYVPKQRKRGSLLDVVFLLVMLLGGLSALGYLVIFCFRLVDLEIVMIAFGASVSLAMLWAWAIMLYVVFVKKGATWI